MKSHNRNLHLPNITKEEINKMKAKEKMTNKRTAYYCPHNDKHDMNGFQITTYDKPPVCSFCGTKLKERKEDET